MIKLTSLLSPSIIGVAAHSPSVRNLKEAAPAPQQGQRPPPQRGAPPQKGGAPQQKQAPAPKPKAPPTQQDVVQQTSDAVNAEDDAGQNNNISLDSLRGQTFMLSKLINAAAEKNQLDALAASFVDQLHIKDFEAFKEATSKFSTIEGYSKLMDSIASMVDHSGESFNSPSGGDAGHGDDNGEGPKEEPMNESDDNDKPIWTQFKPKKKKSKK